MSDPLEHRDIMGAIQTSRHERVRYRAGTETGTVFHPDEEYEGLTLVIEVSGIVDARAMLAAIEKS